MLAVNLFNSASSVWRSFRFLLIYRLYRTYSGYKIICVTSANYLTLKFAFRIFFLHTSISVYIHKKLSCFFNEILINKLSVWSHICFVYFEISLQWLFVSSFFKHFRNCTNFTVVIWINLLLKRNHVEEYFIPQAFVWIENGPNENLCLYVKLVITVCFMGN